MNYESVYQTLKAKLTALVKNASVRLPNEEPTQPTALDIDVSVTETDSNPHTEETTKHDVSIDLLISVPVSTGTERINNIVSQLVAAFDPLTGGSFWTDDRQHFVRISSVSQKQSNITDGRYQINVRILATIYKETEVRSKEKE
jgi:hypothetical protein